MTEPIPTLADVEREHIIRVYEANCFDKEKTARDLDICLKTLYGRLHRYGLLPPLKRKRKSKNERLRVAHR